MTKFGKLLRITAIRFFGYPPKLPISWGYWSRRAWMEPIVVQDQTDPHEYVLMSRTEYEALTSTSDKLATARTALLLARDWFANYETMHRAKDTPEGHLKADANADRAAFCFEAAREDA